MLTRAQLVAFGLTPRQIDHRLANGALDVVHRGVFALSRALLTREGRWLAAVLATGDGAVLSHRSAAALWQIRPGRGLPPDVTTTARKRSKAGIRTHYLPLLPDEATIHEGIPVTTPARTIFDLAATARPRQLERAMREAEFLRLGGGPSLRDLAARYPRRTGVVAVRAFLSHGWTAAPIRSNHELRFLELVDRYELPPPEVNALLELGDEQFEVDFLWRAERVVVEIDPFSSHGTSYAFESDRRRDRLLQVAGFDVIRITPRALEDEEVRVVADLRRLLAARS